jgi:hypothetical protein
VDSNTIRTASHAECTQSNVLAAGKHRQLVTNSVKGNLNGPALGTGSLLCTAQQQLLATIHVQLVLDVSASMHHEYAQSQTNQESYRMHIKITL